MIATIDVPSTEGTLAAMLEGLVLVNVALLDLNPLPPLYRSGVSYEREKGTENWLTCAQVFARNAGDCEDLCCWRAAELRRAGDDAEVIVIRGGVDLWHVLVQREDGTLEDPSRILGMKG
jgi:hypothetical protein